jgi:PAS domain S-box-containing protein
MAAHSGHEGSNPSDLKPELTPSTSHDSLLDDLLTLVSVTLKVPIVRLSLVKRERQWFTSQLGMEIQEISSELTFSNYVMETRDTLVLADVEADSRFADNPAVANASEIRFYVGVPLRTAEGEWLGVLSAIDREPRQPTNEEQTLRLVAVQIVAQLATRKGEQQAAHARAEKQRMLRKKEAELRDANMRLRALFDSMEEGVIVQDQFGAVVSTNAAAERILRTGGVRLEDQSAHGPPIAPLVRRDGTPLPDNERPAAHVLRTGESITDRVMGLLRPNGRTTWISVNAAPLRVGDKARPSGVVLTLRDITEREILQEALSKSLADFGKLVANLPVGIAVSHGRVMRYVNRALVDILGYDDPSELEGSETLKVIHPNSEQAILQRYAGMAQGNHPGPGILECRKKDGTSVLVEVTSMPTVFEDQPAILAIIRDVTEAARARQAQERSEARFRALVNFAPVGIFETDLEGRCVYANDWARRITGVSPEEVLGDGWRRHVHPDDLSQLTSQRSRATTESGDPALGHEVRFTHADRTVFAQLLSVPLGSEEQTTNYLSALVDLTDLHTAQAALAKSEASFRTLAERAPIGIGVRVGAKVTFANPALLKMYGCESADDLVGKDVSELTTPQSRARLSARLRETERGEAVGVEVFGFQRPDGQEVLFEVDSINLDFRGVLSTLSLLRDVTELERARAERDSAHSALVESLAQKETLLKEVHHRVKNNLQVIASLLRLGRGTLQDSAALTVFNDSIARIHSIAMVHERLYQSHDLARIEMSEYLRGLLNELVRAHTTRHRVATDVLAGRLFMDMDRCVPIGLIVNELVSNALKHAFGGQPPRPPAIVVALREAAAGYELEVRDNGVGIDAPAHTSQSLGVRIVTSLAKQLGGSHRVEQDGGTRWVISFPREQTDG